MKNSTSFSSSAPAGLTGNLPDFSEITHGVTHNKHTMENFTSSTKINSAGWLQHGKAFHRMFTLAFLLVPKLSDLF